MTETDNINFPPMGVREMVGLISNVTNGLEYRPDESMQNALVQFLHDIDPLVSDSTKCAFFKKLDIVIINKEQ